MSDDEIPDKKSKILTDAERAQIDKNRQKALQLIQLKKAKLVSRGKGKSNNFDGFALPENSESKSAEQSIIKVKGNKFIDSGGGFLIEQENEPSEGNPLNTEIPVEDDAIDLPVTYEDCIDCGDKFADSYLLNNFNYAVCDRCCDNEDKHSLITKTEAKQEYLLKDCDLDKREPILKFITRKNPHHQSWGDMKLYLHIQIEERALNVWGSEYNLLKERELREDKREMSKMKKYNKKLKHLRMNVRSSLYDKTTPSSHTHNFGPDTYNEEDDTYTHTCLICKFIETYEKM